MSDTTEPELFSLLTNVCKPPQNFNFQNLSSPLGLFGLKSFLGFVILGGRIEPIACLLFYLAIKCGKIFKKTLKMENSSKIQKTYKCCSGTHRKRQILFDRFLGENTLFLTPPSF